MGLSKDLAVEGEAGVEGRREVMGSLSAQQDGAALPEG